MERLDSNQPYIIKVKNLLTPEECAELIERIEALGPELATINSYRGPVVNVSMRNNDRVIFDDAELAALLCERLGDQAPTEFRGGTLVGANERLRCYRYQPGMQFRAHSDGAFIRNAFEQSFYSFLVYLNEDFEGGATTFLTEPEMAVQPETGMGLLFQHPIIHEGSLVTAGVKYVARTDLMYRAEPRFE